MKEFVIVVCALEIDLKKLLLFCVQIKEMVREKIIIVNNMREREKV